MARIETNGKGKPKARVSKAPEVRRAELIAAARHLFDLDGVDNTRVSDIVRDVGVAQGVFYYYFHSKEEIVNAVVDEIIGELEKDIQAIQKEENADFCKKLSGLLHLYLRLIDQFTGDGALVPPLFACDDVAVGEPIKRARDVLMEYLRSFVLQGVQQGMVKARYPAFTLDVLEAGLHWAASKKLPTKDMVFSAVEEALCLPQGELSQYQ